MTETGDFTDNAARDRFELTENGVTSFANYRKAGDMVTITHVETPEAARGGGAAGRLMTEVALLARARAFKVAPLCSYAVAWFRRHPDFHDVLE